MGGPTRYRFSSENILNKFQLTLDIFQLNNRNISLGFDWLVIALIFLLTIYGLSISKQFAWLLSVWAMTFQQHTY